MRQAKVYYNQQLAGVLTEEQGQYIFEYTDAYYANTKQPPISVTLPKSKKKHLSAFLFPFFYNMLSEGANRKLQTRIHKLDDDDDFGLLLKTATNETIGAITVEPITQ